MSECEKKQQEVINLLRLLCSLIGASSAQLDACKVSE